MLRYLLIIFAVWCALGQAKAEDLCKPGIVSDKESPVAYKNRGDRCEGLFFQKVAASADLILLGVHSHAPQFQLNSNRPIGVSAPGVPAVKRLYLRILSSRYRHYYRLDTAWAGPRFNWERGVINTNNVDLKPSEVKALLCEGSCDTPDPLIIPVSISDGSAPTQQAITLWFRAAVDLKELYITLERKSDKYLLLKEKEILGGRSLPAGAPHPFSFRPPRGLYALHATAVPSSTTNAMNEVRARILIP